MVISSIAQIRSVIESVSSIITHTYALANHAHSVQYSTVQYSAVLDCYGVFSKLVQLSCLLSRMSS